jgi:hypothetical protein
VTAASFRLIVDLAQAGVTVGHLSAAMEKVAIGGHETAR